MSVGMGDGGGATAVEKEKSRFSTSVTPALLNRMACGMQQVIHHVKVCKTQK